MSLGPFHYVALFGTWITEVLSSPMMITTSPIVRQSLATVQINWTSLSQMHFDLNQQMSFQPTFDVTYSDCIVTNRESGVLIGKVKKIRAHDLDEPIRVAWVVPHDVQSGGCISVFDGGHHGASKLLARSLPLDVASAHRKRSTRHTSPLLEDFDDEGPWFDGVAYISEKTAMDGLVVAAKKSTHIGIVGGGIAGLAMAHMLDSVGLHNWEIIEASKRIGGRIRTEVFPGTDEWVEMGVMRLPYSVTYANGETLPYADHRMVFQMAERLNKMNNHDPRWSIDFIPFIQHSPNELLARGTKRLPADGRIPTRKETEENPELVAQPVSTSREYNETRAKMDNILHDPQVLKRIQTDVWRAHKQAMEEGLDDWSERSMMRHVFGASENTTSLILSQTDFAFFWDEMHDNSNFMGAGTKYKCVDRGFSRFSEAFWPHISNRTTLNRKIRKLEPTAEGKVRLSWFKSVTNRTYESKEFDRVVLAIPFTQTRFMKLPEFSSVLQRAIGERGLHFTSACKVALLFKERFWEHLEKPIFGGRSEPPSEAIATLYYPSYGVNETRPGFIMHYRNGDWSDRFVSLSDEEHVGMVLDSIVDLHGEGVRDLYTGQYKRKCWLADPHIAAAWSSPKEGEHKLYIPAYHKTEHNTIFIGEHTSFTHAWLSSAIESATRGTVQLLLDLGLIDEAKAVNREWMGRWIRL